jgi:hypothetical protein
MSAVIDPPIVPRNVRLICYGMLALALTAFFLSVARKDWTELPLYMQAAERLQRGEAIYRHDERPWTYPALFALPFVPLLSLPPAVRAPLWHGVNVAAVLLLIWLVERRVLTLFTSRIAPLRRPSMLLFAGLLLALAGRHMLSPLENQSHDLLVFLCVVLAGTAWSKDRDLSAGWWAGLGAALKATPLLFLAIFLWQRRWRAAAVMVIVVPTLSLLPDLLYPAADGVSWTAAWHREFLGNIQPGQTADSPRAWDPWCQLNQSLAGTLRRLMVPLPSGRDPILNQVDVSVVSAGPMTVRLVTLAAQGAVFIALLWMTRRRALEGMSPARAAWCRFGQLAALVTAMVLLSPTSIKTHFCVLLLPAAFLLGEFLYQRRDPFIGVVLVAMFLFSTLTVKGLIGADLGNPIMAAGSVTWCSLGLFLATGLALSRRSQARATLAIPYRAISLSRGGYFSAAVGVIRSGPNDSAKTEAPQSVERRPACEGSIVP